MPNTEVDLDKLINEVLDDQAQCRELPYICGMIHTTLGRKRLFETIKKMVLEQGETDIESILVQFEVAHDFKY